MVFVCNLTTVTLAAAGFVIDGTGTSFPQAFTVEQKAALLAAAKARRSKVIYPALMLALHAGMRDAEVRGLQWGRVDLERAIVTVGNRHWLDVQFRCDLPRYRRVIMPYDLVFARSSYFNSASSPHAALADFFATHAIYVKAR
jgi:integrase